MYRLLIGFLIVIGPIQVGLAVTLIHPHTERRSQIVWVLVVALVLGMWTAARLVGACSYQAAKVAQDRLFSTYVAPLIVMAILRLTWGGSVQSEWQAFQNTYMAESIPDSPGVSESKLLTPIRGMPGMPSGPSGQPFRWLIAAIVRDLVSCALRILSSTPVWAYLGSLLIALCYRPVNSSEAP